MDSVKVTQSYAETERKVNMRVKFWLLVGMVFGAVLCGNCLAQATIAPVMGATTNEVYAPEVPPPADAKPAPVNEYKGMQEREEVFEFSVKPQIAKGRERGSWLITFASKGNCDATVSIVDTNGVVIRHLASGVLGKNAPYPFQQDSLSQKIEWDGLTDDFKPALSGVEGKADAVGFKVKVSLGLQVKFDCNIDNGEITIQSSPFQLGKAEDGTVYVGSGERGDNAAVRAYDKDGKYLRTILPLPAAEIEKNAKPLPNGYASMIPQNRYGEWMRRNGEVPAFATTKWGDKVPFGGGFGLYRGTESARLIQAQPGVKSVTNVTSFAASESGLAKLKGGLSGVVGSPRMSADRRKDILYIRTGGGTLDRFDGRTGEKDKSWKVLTMGDGLSEFCPDLDGRVYVRSGGAAYGTIMFRVDYDGKVLPFTRNVADNISKFARGYGSVTSYFPREFKGMSAAAVGAVYCGTMGYCNCWQTGLHVSPNGIIATSIHEVSATWVREHNLPLALSRDPGTKEAGGVTRTDYALVWSSDGDLLSASAVDGHRGGQGIAMDRDGNLYLMEGGVLPAGQKSFDGVDYSPPNMSVGTLIKYRGQGGKYPLGKISWTKEAAPAEAVKLSGGYATGALWAYGGTTETPAGGCPCNHQRFDMDYWARLWVPSTAIFSVVVLDSNGNRIARLGRYGNRDDGEADLKANGSGLRFVWPKLVTVSDAALYVADTGDSRIVRATIGYAVEETVELK